MFYTFLKMSIHPFQSFFSQLSEELVGKQQPVQCYVKVLQTSWVAAVDSFFKKSPKKEVRLHKVWGSWR